MLRWIRIAVCLLAALVLLWQGVMIPFSWIPLRTRQANHSGTVRGNAAEEAYLASFAPARRALHDEPVIGYLTGAPLDVDNANPYREPYMRAQYAMAPIVIDPTPERPIVLVNYLPAEIAQLERLLKQPGVALIMRLGPGRALVRMPEH